jgi:hypothetical protein
VAGVTDAAADWSSAHSDHERRAAQKLCSGWREHLLWPNAAAAGRWRAAILGGIVIRTTLLAIGVAGFAVVGAAQSQPASPVCVYGSKSYTDGALICAYRSLMLTCSAESAKATWKPVTDRSLASACDTISEGPRVETPSRPHRRHGIRHAVRINADRSAKCFVFNGKQYCE